MSSVAKFLTGGTEANKRPPVNPAPITIPPPPRITIPKPLAPPPPTPPPPTMSGADAAQAATDTKLQARRRGGILQTTVAGETGTGGKRQILG